ncbi:hypothetical protein AJ85_19620 [Alkalihalobacillus alcalophilus ATCC 27647 = CGMCC 1.3604]|uniref:Amine oxidase domain-containing protein n=1 Tax=Alkalihalobacillus alcalophilus ATCC 27647 = CGMCC 1.3604 TaxID=1218173 RepID=A0A094WJ14_ALKAL|nr:NAD(P)/FAD-dependent oxidoreductase [Alkalihalobacillus alcalophilus]KGA95948.1 hypothetical protein BALCAV_0219235 [Alkalihalobacillus alcalophilus ATCC 27647 = CGMCC 1.3604]MED1561766.1 NAD(P)/FAD-dependent oxidoreductase [Alkalihalobacillus alcalophilus]THG89090.1 hypothetical protein AJ85_19620 [Alkalihalobacillus alcalophilus ATCC 27647 = CGMCC 1.3604]
MQDFNKQHYDVIIVGAGLAGLSAAKILKEKGINYKVIEANSRPGGKVFSSYSTERPGYFELGAQFLNKDMTEMVELIKRSGMEILETDVTEDAVEIDEIKKISVDSIIEEVEKDLFIQIDQKDERLFELYKKRIKDNHIQKIISSYHSELFNINPKNLSSKALLDAKEKYLSTQSDLTHQASGPLNHLVLSLEKISKDKIVYDEPVNEVLETEKGYKIRSVNHEYTSDAVILAIPPTAASRLTYSPNLNHHFEKALYSYSDGAIIKMTWAYKKPFWHEYVVEGELKRLKGVIYTESQGVSVIDSSKVGDESRLTMFIGADIAKRLAMKSKAQRIEYALERLHDVFGEVARNYLDMEECVWVNDPYCGGGYSAKVHFNGLYNAATS